MLVAIVALLDEKKLYIKEEGAALCTDYEKPKGNATLGSSQLENPWPFFYTLTNALGHPIDASHTDLNWHFKSEMAICQLGDDRQELFFFLSRQLGNELLLLDVVFIQSKRLIASTPTLLTLPFQCGTTR